MHEPELDGATVGEAYELEAAGFLVANPTGIFAFGEIEAFWNGDSFAGG